MPTIHIRGATLYYEQHGRGRDTIVFSHGFLLSSKMFRKQIERLKDTYRCIAFDWRGQGKSSATRTGYSMEELHLDAVEFIREVVQGPCHFVGISMGGFIGLRLGARNPELIQSLTLAGTSADSEDPKKYRSWKRMAYIFRFLGPRPVIHPVMKLLFGDKILNDPKETAFVAAMRDNILKLPRRATFETALSVINRQSVVPELSKIQVPTLIINGEQDTSRSTEESEQMQAQIAQASLVKIPNAGHSASLEAPDAFTDALLAFLKSEPHNALTTETSVAAATG